MMSVVSTRGLVAAILATMPLQYGLFYADLYLNITLVVIISTAIFSTVGVYLLKKRATAKKTSVEPEVESINGK
jgi:NhaP-type Na+/H+ and K+/H+ antiporter